MAVVNRVRRVSNPSTRKRVAGRRKSVAAAPKRKRRIATAPRAKNGRFKRTVKARTRKANPVKRRRRVVSRPRTAKRATTRRRTASNPKRATPIRRRRRVTKRKSNPALLVTLGAVNPRKGASTMAKRKRSTRRRSNPTATRRRRRRANSNTRVIVMSPKRRNPRRRRTARRNPAGVSIRRRRRTSIRRRNPEVFGMRLSGRTGIEMIGGGLIGVAGTKTLTAAIVTRIPMLQTDIGRVLTALGVAYAMGIGASKFAGATAGSAVFFGGLMQVGSTALNIFMPSLGSALGLGEFMASRLTTPYNPISLGAARQQAQIAAASAVPVQARIGVSGLSRSYGNAY